MSLIKTFSQQDLADIWQGIPPGSAVDECNLCGCINAEFDLEEVVIEEKELVNKILTKDTRLHWMIFKVKKRASKNFERRRREQLGIANTQIKEIPAIAGEYTYNWPYDYCSLVELVKIDQGTRWLSEDIEGPCTVPGSSPGPVTTGGAPGAPIQVAEDTPLQQQEVTGPPTVGATSVGGDK